MYRILMMYCVFLISNSVLWGHSVTLSNARLEKNENQVGMDGVLGMDFINRFNRVTLYFNNMSISMD